MVGCSGVMVGQCGSVYGLSRPGGTGEEVFRCFETEGTRAGRDVESAGVCRSGGKGEGEVEEDC